MANCTEKKIHKYQTGKTFSMIHRACNPLNDDRLSWSNVVTNLLLHKLYCYDVLDHGRKQFLKNILWKKY